LNDKNKSRVAVKDLVRIHSQIKYDILLVLLLIRKKGEHWIIRKSGTLIERTLLIYTDMKTINFRSV